MNNELLDIVTKIFVGALILAGMLGILAVLFSIPYIIEKYPIISWILFIIGIATISYKIGNHILGGK